MNPTMIDPLWDVVGIGTPTDEDAEPCCYAPPAVRAEVDHRCDWMGEKASA